LQTPNSSSDLSAQRVKDLKLRPDAGFPNRIASESFLLTAERADNVINPVAKEQSANLMRFR
jgi:hypothetical protein